MAEWYCTHCGMQVLKGSQEPPFAHFLADSGGRLVLEIYTTPAHPIPDYPAEHPSRYHFAFASENPADQASALEKAGASVVEELTPGDGSHIFMLRDPWGIPLQLCKRGQPW